VEPDLAALLDDEGSDGDGDGAAGTHHEYSEQPP
jgi:hypothetical protein